MPSEAADMVIVFGEGGGEMCSRCRIPPPITCAGNTLRRSSPLWYGPSRAEANGLEEIGPLLVTVPVMGH